MADDTTTFRIFDKLDTISGDLANVKTDVGVIKEQMLNKADKLFVVDSIDSHKRGCKPSIIPSPYKKNTGDIKIRLQGLPAFIKYFLYVAIPAITGLIGHLS